MLTVQHEYRRSIKNGLIFIVISFDESNLVPFPPKKGMNVEYFGNLFLNSLGFQCWMYLGNLQRPNRRLVTPNGGDCKGIRIPKMSLIQVKDL